MIFFEPKRLYNGPFDGHHDQPVQPWAKIADSEVPDGHYTVPLGKAAHRARRRATSPCWPTAPWCMSAVAAARGQRHRRRGDRPAHARAGGHRGHRRLGEEDRPLRHRARGDAHLAASAPSCRRWCRSTASITWRRRSSASPAGTRPIRTPSNGSTSPGPKRVAEALQARDGGLKMGRFVFKLPDVGEGTAEAEIVAWHVKVGDVVEEDQPLVDVMTDKATVEMTSPVAGKVVAIARRAGRDGRRRLARWWSSRSRARATSAAAPRRRPPRRNAEAPKRRRAKPEAEAASAGRSRAPAQTAPPRPSAEAQPAARSAACATRTTGEKPLASPAVRRRARGPGHRAAVRCRAPAPPAASRHEDLDAYVASGGARRRRRRASGYAAARRRRRGQGHRPAPPHRREDAGGQAPHPALRLCRGGRHDRAGGAARPPERHQASRPAEAHRAAVPDARAGQGAAGTIRRSTPASTTRPAWCTATPRVHIGIATQTAERPDRAGGAPRRGARRLGRGRRGRARRRRRARRTRRAQGRAHRLDHHHHQPGPAGRRRHHAGDQPSRRSPSSAPTRSSTGRWCATARSSCAR